jgi:DNA-binding transcriptional LysR family regulator
VNTPSQMEIFVEVVRQEGFSAAARELNVSKSHVSKQVDRLEEHLGVRLLHRTTRQVAPTEEGELFFERAQRILADIEDAERAVSQLQSSPTGTLRITAPMTFGLMYLNPLLCDFLSDHPGLDAEIHFTDKYVDLVGSGLDLGVRIGELKDSSLIARQLATVKMITVAGPDYLERRGVPSHPSELSDHDCLRYSYQLSGTTWQYEHSSGEETSVKVDGRVIANNGRALTQAAVAGLGVYFVPDFIVAEYLRNGELTQILNEWTSRPLTLSVVYPHRRFLPRKVRLFVDFLADHFDDGPDWQL